MVKQWGGQATSVSASLCQHRVHTIDVYLVSDCTSAKETFGTSKSKSSLLEPVIVFSDDMESHIICSSQTMSSADSKGLDLLFFLEPAEDMSEINNVSHVIREDNAVVTALTV